MAEKGATVRSSSRRLIECFMVVSILGWKGYPSALGVTG
jgi:hypothetical protein